MNEGNGAGQDLVELWLAGRPMTTRTAYLRDVGLLLRAVGKPLQQMLAEDLARFAQQLTGSAATRARQAAAVKSLFAFGAKVGVLQGNPALALRGPRTEGRLHERILDEEQVTAIIANARLGRDRCLIRTLYLGGLRISEALGLRFQDLGRKWLTVHGKGSRTRSVVVPEQLVREICALRWKVDQDDACIFKGASGRPISGRLVRRLINNIAEEAIGKPVSAHWFRHSHATHAVERGAPLQLVQRSLGHRSLATTAIYLHVRPGEGSSQFLVG